jgi:hypothetical protein
MGEGECDTLLQTRNAAISLLRNSSQLWDLLSQTLTETGKISLATQSQIWRNQPTHEELSNEHYG